jgi:hypothetical protein
MSQLYESLKNCYLLILQSTTSIYSVHHFCSFGHILQNTLMSKIPFTRKIALLAILPKITIMPQRQPRRTAGNVHAFYLQTRYGNIASPARISCRESAGLNLSLQAECYFNSSSFTSTDSNFRCNINR